MNLIKLLKDNFFLILFLIVSLTYAYGIANELDSIIYFYKPFIVSSITAHYVINTNQINKVFLFALVAALLGDLFFNIITEHFFILAMTSFLVFNLLLMILAAEKAGEISVRFLLISTIPFIFILAFVLRNYLNNVGNISILLTIFGSVVVLLGAFSSYAYFKKRNRTTLYFLLGSLAFVIATVSKGLKQFTFMYDYDVRLINTIAYTFSLFFFCRAMVIEQVVTEKKAISQESIISQY